MSRLLRDFLSLGTAMGSSLEREPRSGRVLRRTSTGGSVAVAAAAGTQAQAVVLADGGKGDAEQDLLAAQVGKVDLVALVRAVVRVVAVDLVLPGPGRRGRRDE